MFKKIKNISKKDINAIISYSLLYTVLLIQFLTLMTHYYTSSISFWAYQ